MVQVELVYVTHSKQTVRFTCSLQEGATVLDAIEQSNIYTTHPETKEYPLGIYAQQASLNTVLKAGDRIEIYRPLTIDPKEKRRKLAKKRV